MALGILLVFAGAYLGSRAGLRETLVLDLRGEVAEGSYEQENAGGYRIRYVHPDGTRYARTGQGSLGVQRFLTDGGDLAIVYNPLKPRAFQPRWLSVLPALGAGGLFFAGMYLLVMARREVMRRTRVRRGSSSG
jgi:hypothetical protein